MIGRYLSVPLVTPKWEGKWGGSRNQVGRMTIRDHLVRHAGLIGSGDGDEPVVVHCGAYGVHGGAFADLGHWDGTA